MGQEVVARDTMSALEAFAAREQEIAPKSRLLLKLVGDHLEAIDEGKIKGWGHVTHFFDLFINKPDYKLNSIISFLQSDKLQANDIKEKKDLFNKVIVQLDKKIEHHNKGHFSKKIDVILRNQPKFQSLFSAPSFPQGTAATPPQAETMPSPEVSPAPIPADLLANLDVEATYGYNCDHPANACYLNSTLQALRTSPKFREFFNEKVAKRDDQLEQVTLDKLPIAQSLLKIADMHQEQRVAIWTLLLAASKKNDIHSYLDQADEITALGFTEAEKRQFVRHLTSLLSDLNGKDFQKQQEARKLLSFPFIAEVNNLYNTLEGKAGKSPQVADHDTVQSIRQLTRLAGWEGGETTQEDAVLFFLHVLEQLQKGPIVSEILPKGSLGTKVERQRHIPLFLEGVKSDTSVGELAHKTGICFVEENLPKLLPLCLQRFDQEQNKVFTPIKPDLKVEIPLLGSANKATYRLHAIVVHSGDDLKSGHYYTYIPKMINGTQVWLKYDDVYGVKLFAPPETPLEDINENGYLYLYELEG